MIPLLAGVAAGALHVVAGPDHLAAVTPLAMREPLRGARTGAVWGLGHATGVIVLGAIGALANSFVHVQSLAAWSEFLVGIALLGIGLWALRQSQTFVVHSHAHLHEQVSSDGHEHVHVHVRHATHAEGAHKHHSHAAFGVGLLHGAAGTGHLLGVVPSLMLPPAQAAVYLLSYGAAAVASMSAFGLGVGHLGRRVRPGMLRALMVASGVFASGLGVFWMISGWPSGA